MSEPTCALSVVIVNWNGGEALLACLASVCQTTAGMVIEVWLVDNASSDGSADLAAAAHPGLHLIRNHQNLGFAHAANQALARARGEMLLLLNPDASLDSRALSSMMKVMEADPHVGIIGCPSVNEAGAVTPAYEDSYPGARRSRVAPEVRVAAPRAIEVGWVSGACLLARRAMVEQIGLLDDGFFMYYEDVDWCYRARQNGWRVVALPDETIHHQLGGAARQAPPEDTARRVTTSRLRFFRKHYRPLRAAWLTAGVLGSNLARWLLLLTPSLVSPGARQAQRIQGARLSAALRGAKR